MLKRQPTLLDLKITNEAIIFEEGTKKQIRRFQALVFALALKL